MDVRFITLRIFKFQEKEKTRLKSDFGLFFESDFFLIFKIRFLYCILNKRKSKITINKNF